MLKKMTTIAIGLAILIGALALLIMSPVETYAIGGCPDGFRPVGASADPSVDRNDDGIICRKVTPGHTVFIDNNGGRR